MQNRLHGLRTIIFAALLLVFGLSDAQTNGFILSMDTVSGNVGQQVVVNAKVKNFIMLLSAQGTIGFDTSVLHFVQVEHFGLTTLTATNFGTNNAANGYITFSWTDNTLNGINLANDSDFFAIRFTIAQGVCQNSSLSFISSPTPAEFVDTSYNPISYTLNRGMVIPTGNNVIPTISISGNGSICSGAPASFTASVTNGGSTPGYQWKVNGVNAGSNSGSFTSSSLTNGNLITCVLTSNAVCANPATATSNTDTITVNPNVTPTIGISGNNIICVGASTTFTATITNGGSTPAYQWKVDGVNAGSNSNSFTSSALTNGNVLTCVLTSNATCLNTSTATSNNDTIAVNASVTPTISIGGNNTICAGTSTTFTATITNGGSSPVYQWKVNGTNAGSNSNSFTSSTLTNGQVVTCVLTSSSTCAVPTTATSNGLTMAVSSTVVPTISISGGNTICSGASATFTASITNGGSSPGYQWKVNGTNAGTNSSSFTSSTLTNGQIVTCVLSSNANCANPATATSNNITMTVNANVTPTIGISGNNIICAGASTTFTSIITNGGNTPVYQWKVDGTNAGTNSSSFTSSTLTNGNVITCVLTSNATCLNTSTATSNNDTIAVNASVTPTISIGGNNTICAGTSTTFSATITNGGSSPVYQWKVNGINAGSNSNSFTSSTFTNGQVVTCVLTSNSTCAVPTTATSNSLTMAVSSTVVPTISISGGNTICSGASATFTASITNGGSSPAYQWKVNGTNAGTNSSSFTSSTLTNGQIVTCVLSSNANCANPATATSNNITMTVNANVTPTIGISGNNIICAGASTTFTSIITNGGNTPAYQWKVDGVNVGSNSSSFTSSALTNGNVLTCVLTSNAVCANPTVTISNADTMTVNPVVTPTISISGNSVICSGNSTTFTANINNGGSSPAYQWKVNGVNAGTNTSTFSSVSLTNGAVITCILTSNATCVNPATATSNKDTMTVSGTIIPTISISGNNNICSGASTSFTATANGGGSTPSYQWKVNGSNAGTGNSTFTTSSLSNGDQISCILTSSASCANPSAATSNNETMVVNPIVVPTINITGNNNLCYGESGSFSAVITNGGNTPIYQWKVNGVNAGSNSSSFSSSTLTNTNIITCIISSNAVCANPVSVTSNNDTVTVGSAIIITPTINNLSCNNSGDGSINIAVGGGSPNYSFNWNNGGSTQSLSSLNAGSYSLTVTDSHGCAATDQMNVREPGLVYTLGRVRDVSCAGFHNGSIIDSAIGGTGPYSYSWSNGETVSQINSLNGGAYYVTVSDAHGCQAISPFIVKEPTPLVIDSVVTANVTCFGSANGTISISVTGGTAPNAFNWTNGATTKNLTGLAGGIFRLMVTDSNGCIAMDTFIISEPAPVIPTINISGNNVICNGSSTTFTAVVVNGGNSPIYQWKVNGATAGNNSNTFTSTSLTNGAVVTCLLTSNANCANPANATSNRDTMIVSSAITPNISISADQTTACTGDAITFTAAANGGGSSPAYQWKVNGTNAGTGNLTFSTSSLNNGDVVLCVLTSSASCANPATGTSNSIAITISSQITPTLNINTANTTVCAGTTVTFTASNSGGGISPSYQWKLNGNNIGSNSNSFTSATINSGDIINCVLTSSLSCANPNTAASNGVTMIVYPVVYPTISINGNNTICAGNSVTFNANITNGGSTPAYQWKVNGSGVGTDSASFTSSSFNNGDVITCVITSNATCVNPATGTSNNISMTVNPSVLPTIYINGNNSVCTGTAVTITASVTHGGNNPTYQWQINGSNTGTNASSITSTALNNGDTITCLLTSSASCASPAVVHSNSINMIILSLANLTATITATDTVICEGQPVTFTASVTGQGSAPTYVWLNNSQYFPGDTNAIFTTSSLTGNPNISINVTSSSTCVTPQNISSNIIHLTVNQPPATPIITRSGDTLISSALNNNQWYLNDTAIAGANGHIYLPQQNGNYYAIVTDSNHCSSHASNNISFGVGIQNISDFGIKIYPNPAEDVLFVQSGNSIIIRIDLVNMLGQTMVSNEENASNCTVDISHIAVGNYVLMIHSKDGIAQRRITVMRK